MVNNIGIWTYEPNTPECKKCDCDRLADWIMSCGYKVETTIENVTELIWSYFDEELRCNDDYEDSVKGCIEFIENSGGIGEFDYWY
jgi:hypothetical protein